MILLRIVLVPKSGSVRILILVLLAVIRRGLDHRVLVVIRSQSVLAVLLTLVVLLILILIQRLMILIIVLSRAVGRMPFRSSVVRRVTIGPLVLLPFLTAFLRSTLAASSLMTRAVIVLVVLVPARILVLLIVLPRIRATLLVVKVPTLSLALLWSIVKVILSSRIPRLIVFLMW